MRRSFTGVLVLTVGALLFTSGPSSAEQHREGRNRPAEPGLIKSEPETFMEFSANVRVTDPGDSMKVSRQTVRVTDAQGHTTKKLVKAKAVGSGGSGCVKNGKHKNLTIYKPEHLGGDGKNLVVDFGFHLYRVRRARIVDKAFTTQFEYCVKGGADGQNGVRISLSGAGTAFKSDKKTHREDYQWRTGDTPEEYSLSQGFQLDAGAVELETQISQNPTEKLEGSFESPYADAENPYTVNAVRAWWEDSCFGNGCASWEGSNKFQGTIHHGLWEFKTSRKDDKRARNFSIKAYVTTFCANPVTNCL